jgi:hypothetical protein
MGGKALWQCVTQLRSNALHEDCSDRVECWHGRDMTVEISVTSATEMQMRLSPMSKVTNFMENKPLVSQGEFITVASSEAQKLKHDTDTMCHEECFFATNALSTKTFCPKCQHPERKPVPLSKVDKDSSRSLRYLCPCGEIRKAYPVRPLQPCPIPDEMLSAHGFQRGSPILTGPPSRGDFDVWLRSGRMNENRLSRIIFNSKSCRPRRAANAERTRIRMTSEQDEEEKQVSGEWRRTRY